MYQQENMSKVHQDVTRILKGQSLDLDKHKKQIAQ